MTSILQLIDSLEIGGAERVAVNLANALSLRGHIVALCSTRSDGPLLNDLSSDVNYLNLNKKSIFDFSALFRLVEFARKTNFQIIHAHSTSVLFAILVKFFLPDIKVLWHDHYGAFEIKKRPRLFYKICAYFIDGVIVVNRLLADWAIFSLHVPKDRVWYLTNFIEHKKIQPRPNLPGQFNFRMICVANLRPQKDHLTLVRAMKFVVSEIVDAQLLLVGANIVPGVLEKILFEIKNLGLENNVVWLGPRNDVQAMLPACDLGILSSSSEGLPLALLEYGAVGLPVVVTDVGECSNVLCAGKFGVLVPPKNPIALADGIIQLFKDPVRRHEIGRKFKVHVQKKYSLDSAIDRLEEIYAAVL